jgi:hypothetical protein
MCLRSLLLWLRTVRSIVLSVLLQFFDDRSVPLVIDVETYRNKDLTALQSKVRWKSLPISFYSPETR